DHRLSSVRRMNVADEKEEILDSGQRCDIEMEHHAKRFLLIGE
ncbi:unnamed protein product, partial [Heterotrigona itama]